MYTGPARPKGQVAVLSEGARAWRHVSSIDGMYVVDPILGGAPFTKGLVVLPGKRKVKVKYLNVDSFVGGAITTAKAEAELTIEAVSGHSYALMGRRNATDYSFWFEDKRLNYNQEVPGPGAHTKKYIKGEAVPGC